MFFHLILTPECNLQCRYCYGKSMDDFVDEEEKKFPFEIDFMLPEKTNFPLQKLKEFIEKDKNTVLTFYGGEPLLEIPKLMEVMDSVKAEFMMQTNGILLHKLPKEYANRFHTILVSLDGNEKLTDYCRGKGIYRKAMNNLKQLKRNGFKGELIARMTVTEKTNIFSAARHLAENKEMPFNSIHWQLDANFWENDYNKRNFREWAKKNYNKNISKLMDYWIKKMKGKGKRGKTKKGKEKNSKGIVLKLYPFLAIAWHQLHNEKTKLMCGAGYENYAIQTDGNIVPCPVMSGLKEFYCGNIFDNTPFNLKKFFVKEPCAECSALNECGGRCLYSNYLKPWPKKGVKEVCGTTKHLIKEIRKRIPKIKELIQEGKISIEQFNYIKFNGAEIIP